MKMLASTLTVLLAACAAAAQHDGHLSGRSTALGEVVFPTSCGPAVQEDFDPAVAMLHSFWYHAAEEAFTEVAKGSTRERDYIAALGQFYRHADRRRHVERKLAYEQAMEELYRRHADDPEARIFYALAVLGTAYSSPSDETYTRQRKAASGG